MNLAETRKRRRLYILLGVVFIFAGLVGILMALFKHLYGLGWGAAQIATWINAIGWIPGIPWLWQHASLVSPGHPSGAWSVYVYVCFGLTLAGAGFCALVARLNHYIRQSGREAHVERLKNERLGYTHPPGSRITTVTNSTFQGSVLGDVTGPQTQITYTSTNDLAALSALVTETLTRMGELPLTPFQRVQFQTQLDTIGQECASHTPNHTVLRRALDEVGHFIRHLAAAGTAHALVAHWQEILQALHLWR